MKRWGKGWRTTTPGHSKLDRGRGSRGAKWCYVTEELDIIDYENAKLVSKATKSGWIFFQSRREAKRWVWLKTEEQVGVIKNLERQVPMALIVVRPDGLKEKIATYKLDFKYEQDGRTVYEDSKGHKEDLYLHKKKHIEAQYGITILES